MRSKTPGCGGGWGGGGAQGDAPVLAQLSLEWAVQESEDNVLDRLDDLKDQAIAKYSEVRLWYQNLPLTGPTTTPSAPRRRSV